MNPVVYLEIDYSVHSKFNKKHFFFKGKLYMFGLNANYWFLARSQLTLTCSKSTIETQEKSMKCVLSHQ